MQILHEGVMYDTTAKDLARLLEYSVSQIRRYVAQGKIKGLRRGRLTLFNLPQAYEAVVGVPYEGHIEGYPATNRPVIVPPAQVITTATYPTQDETVEEIEDLSANNDRDDAEDDDIEIDDILWGV